MPKVSVIIPCYNQGQYVDEAIDSVLAQTFQDFEIIIVNDGSTDDLTNEILKNYNKPKTRVIFTTNQGLSAARNNGIKASNGEYILPLDADDKIADTYLEKAVKILDENNGVGIVYCDAAFFGDKKGKWNLPEFDIEKFILSNQIFCTAFFRRIHYDKTIGYDENMKFGWEDWEFWLSILEIGVKVHKIQEVLFYYRIKQNSMIKSLAKDNFKKKLLNSYVFYKHINLYSEFLDPISANLAIEKNKKEFEATINMLKQSKSYRLGDFLLTPIRILKKLLH